MAVKLFCDGCDTEITDKDLMDGARRSLEGNFHTFERQPIVSKTRVLGQFKMGPWDLCKICIHRLKQVSNPSNWQRVQ